MANERRIVELVIKATGDEEIKRIGRDMQEMRRATEGANRELESLNKSFLGVSAAAAGAFVGNKLQEGFHAITAAVSETITEMNELAEAGGKAAEQLGGPALAAAAAYTAEMAKLQQQFEQTRQQLVAGMLPALVALLRSFNDVVGGGRDFVAMGKAIGDALIGMAQWIAKTVGYVNALGNAFAGLGNVMDHAAKAYLAWQGFRFPTAIAEASKAVVAAQRIQQQWNADVAQGAAVAAKLGDNYRKAVSEFSGAGMPRPKGGGGGKGAGRGGGAAGGAAKPEKLGATQEDIAADRELLDVVTALADAYYKAQAEQAKYIDGLNRAADPTIAFAEGLDRLNEAAAAGGLSAEAYRVELERLYEQLERAGKALVENSKAEKDRKKAEEERRKQLEEAQAQWGFLADAMGQATYDIISGTEKIGQAVKRMVAQIVADFLRLQLLQLAQKFLGNAFGGINFMSAKGNAFGSSGLITGPTLHTTRGGGIGMAGEAGPEAILPLSRNASGQLGVAASGGMNVTVNNNVPGAAVGVRQTDQGLQIDLVERQLADRIRRGGTPLPSALENTYRSGRSASVY